MRDLEQQNYFHIKEKSNVGQKETKTLKNPYNQIYEIFFACK